MILLLIFAALLLYFPVLRQIAGGAITGVLFVCLMAITLGAAGVILAGLVCGVLFVGSFYRR